MSTAFLILVAVFVVGALLRLPIALAMLCAGLAYLFAGGKDVGLAAEQIMTSLQQSYVLLAVPMFILAANVMNAGTISERLWGAANALVGRFKGGLGHVTVVVSVIFSSMSGSALADAAGPGMVAVRMMRDVAKYPAGFAVALTAAASTIAPIIPPSIPMVLYALFANVSVAALFLGGVLPGLIMALALMATVAWLARRRDLPTGERIGAREALCHLARAFLPMTLPVLLLGGIWTGAFTPTEAAAVAALYAMLLAGFIYRALNWKGLYAVFAESLRASTVVMLLIAAAFVINYAVTAEQLDQALAGWIKRMEFSPLGFMLAITVLFIILGCLIDTGTLLLVLVPVLLPTVKALGIDPVYFGVVVIVNLMIGLVTPPFGMVLFVLAGLTKTPLAEVSREVLVFAGALIAALFLMVLAPGTVLWLPRLFGYTG
jgi:tripartite ATP-independent transporter DctM subunit